MHRLSYSWIFFTAAFLICHLCPVVADNELIHNRLQDLASGASGASGFDSSSMEPGWEKQLDDHLSNIDRERRMQWLSIKSSQPSSPAAPEKAVVAVPDEMEFIFYLFSGVYHLLSYIGGSVLVRLPVFLARLLLHPVVLLLGLLWLAISQIALLLFLPFSLFVIPPLTWSYGVFDRFKPFLVFCFSASLVGALMGLIIGGMKELLPSLIITPAPPSKTSDEEQPVAVEKKESASRKDRPSLTVRFSADARKGKFSAGMESASGSSTEEEEGDNLYRPLHKPIPHRFSYSKSRSGRGS